MEWEIENKDLTFNSMAEPLGLKEQPEYLKLRTPVILTCIMLMTLAGFQCVWNSDDAHTPRFIKRYSKLLANSLIQSMPSRYLLSGRLSSLVFAPDHRRRWIKQYRPILDSVASQYSLDPELVEILIAVESGFRADAISPRGAVGLMQVLPTTALDMGIVNPFDPVENMHAGCRYLSYLMKIYKGDLRLALAAYNAGPGAVQKYGGIPPYEETQSYVKKIMKSYKGLQRA